MQQIDSIEALFPFDVDQVLEVPTHEIIGAADGADGDMSGVLDIFGGHDSLSDVGIGKVFHFFVEGQECLRIGKGLGKVIANIFWCAFDLITDEDGGQEPELAKFHLPPKFSRGFLPFVVEVAADDGGVEVKGRRSHGHDGIG